MICTIRMNGLTNARGVDFIQKYLEQGNKHVLIQDILVLLNSKDFGMRAEHMRSVFLLGIHIYDTIPLIKYYINKLVSKLNNDSQRLNNEAHQLNINKNQSGKSQISIDNNGKLNSSQKRLDFLYLWYLICLYHDIGYIYELNEEIAINNNFQPNMIPKIDWIPSEIIDSCDQYYQIRKISNLGGKPCIDHGIYGGMMLYNILKDKHDSLTIESKFDKYNPLLWGKPILDTFIVHAAWCIMGHNMFGAERGTDSSMKYEEWGLQKLIYSKDNSFISPSKHPLLFLLMLVDTIDPIKHYLGDLLNNSNDFDIMLDSSIDTTRISSRKHNNNTLSLSYSPNLFLQKLNLSSLAIKQSSPCRSVCQSFKDNRICSIYACNNTLADKLSFLISPEFSVDTKSKVIHLNIIGSNS